jgi:cytochrome c-type biogenesis protein CcmH/NrfG
LFPNDGNIWDSLGQAYYNNGNLNRAKIAYEKALELDSENSYAKEMVAKLSKM